MARPAALVEGLEPAGQRFDVRLGRVIGNLAAAVGWREFQADDIVRNRRTQP
jgi:hypothetical protein